MLPKEIANLLAIVPCVEFLLSFIFLYLVDTPGFFLSLVGSIFTFPIMVLFYVALYFGLYAFNKSESMIPVYVLAFFALSYTFYIVKYMFFYEKVKVITTPDKVVNKVDPPTSVATVTTTATATDVKK
jgi:hypothetical protein